MHTLIITSPLSCLFLSSRFAPWSQGYFSLSHLCLTLYGSVPIAELVSGLFRSRLLMGGLDAPHHSLSKTAQEELDGTGK